jgi:hypothetical protein
MNKKCGTGVRESFNMNRKEHQSIMHLCTESALILGEKTADFFIDRKSKRNMLKVANWLISQMQK